MHERETEREREREREMQWGRNTLIEQAKEELEILEYQHPNKFSCLKQDLKAYISELESQNQTTTSMSAATQGDRSLHLSLQTKPYLMFSCNAESSNRNKRGASRLIMPHAVGSMKRRCNTDAVLHRAQQCLHKIQHFKTTLS